MRSTELAGVALFVVAAGLPPFDDATEVDLTLHMLQHVLIIVAGVMVAYPHLGRQLLREGRRGLVPGFALVLSALLLVFWHLPGPWDAAVLNPAVHLMEHSSFLLIGMLAGSWLVLLSDSAKIGALMAAFFGHMGYAVALISPWNQQVYALYDIADQALLGWVLLLTGPTLIAGVAYVIARNPAWLGGYPGPGKATQTRRQTMLNRMRVPGWASPGLTVVLFVLLLGYFANAAFAIETAPPPPRSPTVLISETPVTWDYSPQSITVVIGVNATVTWVSRSISYDTVTGRGGLFSSGPIAPGGSYSYTFSSPGEYDYYCIYHPWMTGKVIVLASGT